MGFQSGQVTCTTSAKTLCTAPTGQHGPPTVVVELITPSATVFIGGSKVTNTGGGIGFQLQNGTAPSAGVVNPGATTTIFDVTGDIFVVGAAGSEVVAYHMEWSDG